MDNDNKPITAKYALLLAALLLGASAVTDAVHYGYTYAVTVAAGPSATPLPAPLKDQKNVVIQNLGPNPLNCDFFAYAPNTIPFASTAAGAGGGCWYPDGGTVGSAVSFNTPLLPDAGLVIYPDAGGPTWPDAGMITEPDGGLYIGIGTSEGFFIPAASGSAATLVPGVWSADYANSVQVCCVAQTTSQASQQTLVTEVQ